MFLGRALTGLHLDLRDLFSQLVGAQERFFACVSCVGLVRAFVCTINRSYRVNIGLGSSHRVFLVRALTGPHLDLRVLFSQQVGA